MSSTSGVGNTTITMQFELDRNIDSAAQDVQQAIKAATGLLPRDMPNPPTYRKTNPADRPVLIYAIHSDAIPVYASTTTPTRWWRRAVEHERRRRGRAFSARSPMPCRCRSTRWRWRRAIGIEDVRAAIAAASVNRPNGKPGAAPDHHARHQRPDFRCRRGSASHRRLAQRRADPARRHCRGRRRRAERAHRRLVLDKPAEGLAIQREAGANTIEVVDTIKARLPRLEASLPPSVHVDLVSDRSLVIRAAFTTCSSR